MRYSPEFQFIEPKGMEWVAPHVRYRGGVSADLGRSRVSLAGISEMPSAALIVRAKAAKLLHFFPPRADDG